MTSFTATPLPSTAEAVMWLGYPGPPGSTPGSKKPDPSVESPSTSTPTEHWPSGTVAGVAVVGVAGGGACSLITLTPHELFAFAYSWKVQKVMLSLGSTTVCEKSPQRRGVP